MLLIDWSLHTLCVVFFAQITIFVHEDIQEAILYFVDVVVSRIILSQLRSVKLLVPNERLFLEAHRMDLHRINGDICCTFVGIEYRFKLSCIQDAPCTFYFLLYQFFVGASLHRNDSTADLTLCSSNAIVLSQNQTYSNLPHLLALTYHRNGMVVVVFRLLKTVADRGVRRLLCHLTGCRAIVRHIRSLHLYGQLLLDSLR